MKLLDYLFYRTYAFYKSKRDTTPVLMGCLVLMLMVFSTLLCTSTALEILFKMPQVAVGKTVVLVLLLILLLSLWRRYNNAARIEKLVSNYQDEQKNSKRLKGWLFALYLILVLLTPITIGYLRHNLGMDI